MRKWWLFIVLTCMVSCSSIDCPVENVVESVYELRDYAGGEWKVIDTLTIKTTRKDGTDTILLNKSVAQKFYLPVSYSHPEDVLVFSFDNKSADRSIHVEDTVWVKKEDIPHFESVECNTSFFHTLTAVRHTTNYIDSIVIKKTAVNYDNKETHIYIYPKKLN